MVEMTIFILYILQYSKNTHKKSNVRHIRVKFRKQRQRTYIRRNRLLKNSTWSQKITKYLKILRENIFKSKNIYLANLQTRVKKFLGKQKTYWERILLIQINKYSSLTENRLVVAKGDGMGEGWSGSSGLADVAVTCIEWINNKVLLYSTRNCIQPIGINYNEKEHTEM